MLQDVEIRETPPDLGEIRQVAPGIGWLRVPLPFRLNHVNCWILDDGDHWAVIDCGVDSPDIRKLWSDVGSMLHADKPIRRLITTHSHNDHVGIAGFFVERFRTSYETTLIEYMAARLRFAELSAGENDQLRRFLASHGCREEMLGSFHADRNRTFSYLGPQPPLFRRIVHGGTVRIGKRRWRVIVGSGHAEEHISLYSAEDRILIAGDQILPKITPMVGVFAPEPQADPLGAYIASLERFADLPEDTLVLPSHGEPFTGIKPRLDYLSRHHEHRLAKLEGLLVQPRTAADLSESLFARAVAEGQGRLALAETLAHLNYLVAKGRAVRHRESGIFRFELT